ncbi:MAG: peptide chain release factor N(5)-glutamine methyltransferase [Acidimicrobiia bacterium]
MTRGPTWRALRDHAELALRRAQIPRPEREASWMVERVSGYDAAELVAHGGERATDRAATHVDEMLVRRSAGEPLQYVLGEWSFRALELLVDRRVLIPRPETEVVAECAIDEMVRLGARRTRSTWPGPTSFTLADLGTGSGALALALASELPQAEIWATDVDDDALAVARANLAGAGSVGARVRLALGSWFDALPGSLCGALHLVVSNPPYVAESELDDLPPEVRDFEPRGALCSGPTGLEAIQVVVAGSARWLAPGGAVVCELAPHQAGDALDLARAAGFSDVTVRMDFSGRDRVLIARREVRDRG